VERQQRIEDIFHEALGRDATAREAYVSDACDGDSGLFREVSSLLANHGGDGDFGSWAPAAAAQLVVEHVLLEPGHRLGPYRIDQFLAAGGMGEGYRATDIRLNREVAIKVSAARFSERFEMEARIVASMTHPNICRLYDVGPNYLVMELVDGPTLSDWIRQGPLPASEALAIARQIAEALEAAHEKGNVHRDLKPANIKITPDGVVKLLDFGLADVGTESSTTDAGTMAGTPSYMSPEQVRGDPVDKRADIWAFGAVLYELLSGKATFEGRTTSETAERILQAEPDWTLLPVTTPARIRTLLRRCLEPDRKQRLRDIGEARIVIDASEESPARQARRIPRPWLIAGGLIVLIICGVSWWRAIPPAVQHAAMRLSVDLDSDIPLATDGLQNALAIAPDDRRLVFTTRGPDGVTRLAARVLDEGRSMVLSGTEHAEGPFFSPDSEWIGFFADGKLKKISTRGGTPVTLSDAPGPRGASWGDDGNIIAALSLGRLTRIPAAGGRSAPVAEASTPNEIERWPQVLPGSQAVLFNAYQPGEDPENARIEILSFATGARKTVARGYFARYLRSGHLVFVRQNTLFAARLDLSRLELSGPPQPILDEISGGTKSGARPLDVSDSGTLVYLSGTERLHEVIAWLDSDGKVQPLHPEAGEYYQPRFSPDGKHLAFAAASAQGMEIWVEDLDRGTASPRSFMPGRSWWPLWTPRGDRIVFISDNDGRHGIYSIRADGSGKAQQLLETNQAIPRSISPDGKRMAFDVGNEIWIASIEDDAEHPRLGARTKFLDAATPNPEAQFSADGRWIAYVSAELGSSEVFVQAYPGPGGRWQISNGGGRFPIWSHNGHELFFLGLDQRIRTVDYTVDGNSFSPGKLRVWSEKRVADLGVNSAYDLAPDGKRIAMILNADQTGERNRRANVTVLVNFSDELRQRLGRE